MRIKENEDKREGGGAMGLNNCLVVALTPKLVNILFYYSLLKFCNTMYIATWYNLTCVHTKYNLSYEIINPIYVIN